MVIEYMGGLNDWLANFDKTVLQPIYRNPEVKQAVNTAILNTGNKQAGSTGVNVSTVNKPLSFDSIPQWVWFALPVVGFIALKALKKR